MKEKFNKKKPYVQMQGFEVSFYWHLLTKVN